jgi:hypothetical protein
MGFYSIIWCKYNIIMLKIDRLMEFISSIRGKNDNELRDLLPIGPRKSIMKDKDEYHACILELDYQLKVLFPGRLIY